MPADDLPDDDAPGARPLLTAPDVRRLAARLGTRPTKALGQNFVIDPNTVRRIVRTAGVGVDDVVVEVGPGLGSLTLGLLAEAARVVAVEIDPVLAAELPATVARHLPDRADRLEVVLADALRLEDVPGPPPTAFVANLPYHVAAPLILESIGGLPDVDRWCVLVQREIAERLVAAPGSALYGAPSALSALALEPTGRHAVSRTVFVPVPNVDSSLVAFRRRPEWGDLAGDWPAIVATVRAAFAYRRKTLVNALVLAGWRPDRAAVEAACRAAGIDAKARAETLPGEVFVALARSALR